MESTANEMPEAGTNTGERATEEISSSSTNDPAITSDLGTAISEMTNLLQNGAITAIGGGQSKGGDEEYDVLEKNADANYRMATDWQVLMSIFPEEVWLQILDSISDTAILESVCNSSLAFRHLLLPRRVQFLFPKFWNIFAVTPHQETSNCIGHATQSSNQCRPYNFPFPVYQGTPRSSELGNVSLVTRRWLTRILQFRMICKSWCDAVDSWIQRHQHRYQVNDQIAQLPADFVFREIGGFEDSWIAASVVNRMELFHSLFNPSHIANGVTQRNPFLGRTVLLRGGGEHHRHQAEEFWNRAYELFQAYGIHISYLTVNIEEGLISTDECYVVIRALLQAVPNLKKLHLSYKNSRAGRGYPASSFWGDELIQLQHLLRINPLPRLAYLKFVTTHPIHPLEASLPPPLYYELLRANDNITKLEIGHRAVWSEYGVSRLTAPNLKQLSMRLRSAPEFVAFFQMKVDWKLSKLKLDLEFSVTMELRRLFRKLELNWGDSLTCLQLKLRKIERESGQIDFLMQSGNYQLNLTMLTHLELTLENMCCFDFLLPMKMLEELEIVMHVTIKNLNPLSYLRTVENGRTIRLLSVAENLRNSNIWEIFAKLKRLKFDCEIKNQLQSCETLKYYFTVDRRLENIKE